MTTKRAKSGSRRSKRRKPISREFAFSMAGQLSVPLQKAIAEVAERRASPRAKEIALKSLDW